MKNVFWLIGNRIYHGSFLKKIGFLLLLLLVWIALDFHEGLDSPSKEIVSRVKNVPEPNWETVRTKATKILSELLKIKTVRGNERQATEYLRKIFAKSGIKTRIVHKPGAPSRANLIAVLEGRSREDGLILMNHLDTVEADGDEWSIPPFQGRIKNGRVYGRGALDMKGMSVIELMAFLLINEAGVPLKHPLMFLSLADEESGADYGARFLTQEKSKLFAAYRFAVNEGGVGTDSVAVPNRKFFNIQFAEKGILWLKVRSRGKSGHGSTPPVHYATKNLVAFLDRLEKEFFHAHIDEFTEPFFAQMAEALPQPKSFLLRRAGNPVVSFLLQGVISGNRHLRAMTSNSMSVTGLKSATGGINVIPGWASATIDIRLRPDEDPKEILAKVQNIAREYNVDVEPEEHWKGSASNYRTTLFQTLAAAAQAEVPDAIITPFVSPGFTDSTYFRKLGIDCYGLLPVLLSAKDIDGIHGKDENISVENLERGIRILYRTLIAYLAE